MLTHRNLLVASYSDCLHYNLGKLGHSRSIRQTRWSFRAINSRARMAFSSSSSSASCTADEIHFVDVPNSDWKLSLWRYNPSPHAEIKRNHPLLLLSGVATNAIAYDLAPGASFARYMSNQGFDTWILELRGAGLSHRKGEPENPNLLTVGENAISEKFVSETLVAGQKSPLIDIQPENEEKSVDLVKVNDNTETNEWEVRLSELFLQVSEKLASLVNENQYKAMSTRLVEQMAKTLDDAQLSERFNEIKENLLNLWKDRQNSVIASQIVEISKRIPKIVEEGQRSVPQIFDLQERLLSTIDDFLKQVELIEKYNWDFDNYLEEDLPAAMNYIQSQSAPKDGKVLAVGHSMGGILLYAHISSCNISGKQNGLAAIVTMGSSLDYTCSRSSLKALIPLADPAQALNVPVLPLGTLMAAVYPLASRPPYALAWLTPQVSARDMMHPELFKKLVQNNFCTVPAKVIIQLATAFRPRGLRNRAGTIYYSDNLGKCQIPVLALAGDADLICPPEAVQETASLIPPNLVTYRVFGGKDDVHYGHYDLVGGRLASEDVYPCIIEFITHHDKLAGCSE